jgi:hypothetical protein
MDMADLKANTDQLSSAICFETDNKTKILDKFYAIFLLSSLSLFSVCFSIGLSVAAVEAGIPVIPVAAFFLIVALLGIRWSWKLAVSKMRFCIIFQPLSLQVGRGPARCIFPYEDIETVALTRFGRHGCCFKLICGRKKPRVYLNQQQSHDCYIFLRHYCCNALLVYGNVREYLPANPTRPDQTLAAMVNHYKKRMWICIIGIPLFGCFFVGYACAAVQSMQNKIQPDITEFVKALSQTVVFGFVFVCCFIGAWRSWRKSSDIQKKRILAKTPS